VVASEAGLGYDGERITEEGDMAVSKETLIAAVTKASDDGRLTCEKAHELGKELDVSLEEIGAVCNELNIRIKDCQLGCF
jgi:CO dehydrogenase nickel-insertion accessory protein CooC1